MLTDERVLFYFGDKPGSASPEPPESTQAAPAKVDQMDSRPNDAVSTLSGQDQIEAPRSDSAQVSGTSPQDCAQPGEIPIRATDAERTAPLGKTGSQSITRATEVPEANPQTS